MIEDQSKNDEEACISLHNSNGRDQLESISDSLGWWFPEVKLASWDPDNKKQWRVSISSVGGSDLLGW